MKLVNHSKNQVERAIIRACPRCKGDGYTLNDTKEGRKCDICRGKGDVWISASGWTRPINGRIGQSEQLY